MNSFKINRHSRMFPEKINRVNAFYSCGYEIKMENTTNLNCNANVRTCKALLRFYVAVRDN